MNIKRVGELTEMGLMHPAGLKTFEARQPERSNAYSFEQGDIELGDVFEEEFRQNKEAWNYFQAQPAGYKKTAIWWVISAKREETKHKRLATLIADSAEGKRLRQVTYTPEGLDCTCMNHEERLEIAREVHWQSPRQVRRCRQRHCCLWLSREG